MFSCRTQPTLPQLSYDDLFLSFKTSITNRLNFLHVIWFDAAWYSVVDLAESSSDTLAVSENHPLWRKGERRVLVKKIHGNLSFDGTLEQRTSL